MSKKKAVKKTARTTRNESPAKSGKTALRKTGAASRETPPTPPAEARGNGKRRGAPKAFSAKQVPLEKISPTRSPLFEKYGAQARQMYVELSLTPLEIERRTKGKVRATTVKNWAARQGWEAARRARTDGPAALVEDVQTIFNEFVKAATENLKKGKLPDQKFWDNLIKGAAAIERLSGDAHFAAHMTKFVEGLLKYTQANRPDQVRAVAELLSGYSTTVLSSR